MTGKDILGTALLGLILSACLWVGGKGGYDGLRIRLKNRTVQTSWGRTTARLLAVEASRDASTRARRFFIQPRYAYAIEGREYVGEAYDVAPEIPFGAADATERVGSLKASPSLEIRFDPKSPGAAVVSTDLSRLDGPQAGAMVFLVVGLGGAGLLLRYLWTRARPPERRAPGAA